MLVDKGVHTIQTSFTDGCNNEYVEGDVVLLGLPMVEQFHTWQTN
jgi:hypothetical protein